MSPDEGTIAEALVQAGYHTGFFADVPHYFVPGMNFTRGFQQWEYIRGQAEDRYRSPAAADPALFSRYKKRGGYWQDRTRAHLVNVQPHRPEENWPTARTFRSAIDFVEENASNSPFYLYVDSFTPHETWEAPLHYYDLYGSREDREPICLAVPYGPISAAPDYEARIDSIRANYAGLITMVDTWFGRLIDTIDRVGLRENTMVVFLSDHGTNFADNPEGIIGKPADYMYPGTMCIPMMLRHPQGKGAGTTSDSFVYTLDIPATLLDFSGTSPLGEIEGQSLIPFFESSDSFSERSHLTCRYGNSVWYKDRSTWFFSGADFSDPRVFDLESDPECTKNIAENAGDRIKTAREHILADAGGAIPIYRRQGSTDALGRPEFSGK